MSVPTSVRIGLRDDLWTKADSLGWLRLPEATRSRYYEEWTRAEAIGGMLSHYMDRGKVRLYLKDSLMKSYAASRLADEQLPFRVLHISDTTGVRQKFHKPHGRLLEDGRLLCWGRAEDWKAVVLAVYERTYGRVGLAPYGAVLLYGMGRQLQDDTRQLVWSVASRLGIERVEWVDVFP